MDRRVILELDLLVRRLVERTRFLPWLTPRNGPPERARLVRCIERRRLVVPAFECEPPRDDPRLWAWLRRARTRAADVPGSELYLRRLDELELDLEILLALGDARRVPPLSARRFGTGAQRVTLGHARVPLWQVARGLLAHLANVPEPQVLPADDPDASVPSAAGVMRAVAAAAGLELRVEVDPRLAAGAAAGDRVVLLAARRFGCREALRLAVHEVLGHLVCAANGRSQPLRILELGTAGSFADQEGLAILLEERAGVLDPGRLRTLAARVVVADHVHAGTSFGDAARELVDAHGFSPMEAIVLAERAYRGGGVARDVGYLHGYLRVRRALERGTVTLDELRAGRLGLEDVPALRRLQQQGWARPPAYRPSLSRSLRATHLGTSLSTSPPSDAASLTRFDAT
jgi:uncharacterized protein (TIGR02421 family)